MGIISRQGLRIEAHCKKQPNMSSLALVALATLQQKQYNNSVLLMKLLKLI